MSILLRFIDMIPKHVDAFDMLQHAGEQCGQSDMRGRHRQLASAYLKALVDVGLLPEIKAGRENLYINPALLELLTERST